MPIDDQRVKDKLSRIDAAIAEARTAGKGHPSEGNEDSSGPMKPLRDKLAELDDNVLDCEIVDQGKRRKASALDYALWKITQRVPGQSVKDVEDARDNLERVKQYAEGHADELAKMKLTP